MNIFGNTAPGKLVAYQLPGDAALGSIKIYDQSKTAPPGFTSAVGGSSGLLIITGFKMGQEAQTQFTQTLDKRVYVYSFGEKLTPLVVTGIAGNPCNSSDHGFSSIVAYYKNNSVSLNTSPINLAILAGSQTTPVFGFLVGLTVESHDPRLELVNFELSFFVLPQ